MYQRVERRSPSPIAWSVRETPAGFAFFATKGSHNPYDNSFIGRTDLEVAYGEPEAWIALQLLARCGYDRPLPKARA